MTVFSVYALVALVVMMSAKVALKSVLLGHFAISAEIYVMLMYVSARSADYADLYILHYAIHFAQPFLQNV